MHYLVTGGLGVIGSLITKKLLWQRNEVTIIDACEEPRNELTAKDLESKTTILRGRLEEHGMHLPEILMKVDGVFHCAAFTGIPQSMIDPSDDWRSNVDATKTLLDALRLVPKPTAVLSSVKPYRVEPDLIRGLDEETVLEPDEPYAASKAAQSMLCMAYAKSYGLPVTVFRCSNLYGPAPCHGPRHGWMTWMAISAAIGRVLEVQGTGNQSRDMLHAMDVYSACIQVFENPKIHGQIFNIGGGEKFMVSVNDVANWLHERTGCGISHGPARKMDDDRVFVDHGKFTRATGWTPTVNPKEGLEEILIWATENKKSLIEVYDGV